MNVIWLSANRLGYELLKETISHKIVDKINIITLSDRSKTVMYDSISKKMWHQFGIKVFEIEKINDENNLINKINPDLIIMCGWRQVISKNILYIPPKGFIGFHPTLLPVGRGPAPIINSILHGFKESGLTMFYVNEHLDSGDIIAQERFRISDTDHAEDVYNKVIKAGKKLISNYLPLVVGDKAPRVKQDHSKAVVFNKPMLKNNRISLEKESADRIYKKIKALSKPYLGAYIIKDGKKLIIWKAELVDK